MLRRDKLVTSYIITNDGTKGCYTAKVESMTGHLESGGIEWTVENFSRYFFISFSDERSSFQEMTTLRTWINHWKTKTFIGGFH